MAGENKKIMAGEQHGIICIVRPGSNVGKFINSPMN